MKKDEPQKYLEMAFEYVKRLAQNLEVNKLRQFIIDMYINQEKRESLFLKKYFSQNREQIFEQLLGFLQDNPNLAAIVNEFSQLRSLIQFN